MGLLICCAHAFFTTAMASGWQRQFYTYKFEYVTTWEAIFLV